MKLQTIKRKVDFKKVLSQGDKRVYPYFVSFSLRVDEAMKCGFIVSKKNGNAVKRNFIKRRLKSLVRNLLIEGYLSSESRYYVCFVARPIAYSYSYEKMYKMMKRLFFSLSKVT